MSVILTLQVTKRLTVQGSIGSGMPKFLDNSSIQILKGVLHILDPKGASLGRKSPFSKPGLDFLVQKSGTIGLSCLFSSMDFRGALGDLNTIRLSELLLIFILV